MQHCRNLHRDEQLVASIARRKQAGKQRSKWIRGWAGQGLRVAPTAMLRGSTAWPVLCCAVLCCAVLSPDEEQQASTPSKGKQRYAARHGITSQQKYSGSTT